MAIFDTIKKTMQGVIPKPPTIPKSPTMDAFNAQDGLTTKTANPVIPATYKPVAQPAPVVEPQKPNTLYSSSMS